MLTLTLHTYSIPPKLDNHSHFKSYTRGVITVGTASAVFGGFGRYWAVLGGIGRYLVFVCFMRHVSRAVVYGRQYISA